MADNSYLKEYRLLSAHDFSNLKINSLLFKKYCLRVYYKKSNLNSSRLGISVSTKVCNSVKRNRLKRLIRESFRLSSFRSSGFDALFVVQTSRTSDFDKFEKEVLKAVNDFYLYSGSNV